LKKDSANKNIIRCLHERDQRVYQLTPRFKHAIEYKLLNLRPEKWSNLRTCLLLKMMAKMLSSGTENDLANTNAKSIFMPDELKMLYPQVQDSLLPIVQKELCLISRVLFL